MQLIRRVGLIGDVHCEDQALELVLEELSRQGVELVLQAGDISDGAGDLERTIALLEQHRVLAVRGNHDRWLLGNQLRDLPFATVLANVTSASLDYLSRLPATRELTSPRGNVLLCHGLGDNDMASVKPHHEGYDIEVNTELQRLIAERRFQFVLNGHTHRSMLRRFGSLSIINAGTLLRDAERCFMIVDFERGELLRFRHAPGELCRDLTKWTFDRQLLAESP
jgi:putative phosphoesterase